MELKNRITGEIISQWDFLNIFGKNISFPKNITEDIYNSYGYDIIYSNVVPNLPSSAYEVIREGEIEIDGKLYQNYSVKLKDISLESFKNDKKEEIANSRFQEEVGGITFGEYTIHTDRESRAIMDSTLDKFERGMLTDEVIWKTTNCWITVNKETLETLVALIVNHVKSCYNKEKELCDIIDNANTIEEVAQVIWA